MKSISFLILLFLAGGTCLQAQNGSPFAQTQQGNAVASSVFVNQVSESRCEIEIRISGNLAYQVTDASISIAGPSIPGGVTYTTVSSISDRLQDDSDFDTLLDGDEVFLKGSFPTNGGSTPGRNLITVDCPQFQIRTYITY